MTTKTEYRGYLLISDYLGTDVWSGSEYLETTFGPKSLEQAKKNVDTWMDAK